jgi:DNA-binding HxlR family transcriptional regulator
MPQVSEKMLYQQLRELERDGLLLRVSSQPRAVSYQLTALAESLVPILASLADWSEGRGVPGLLARRAR